LHARSVFRHSSWSKATFFGALFLTLRMAGSSGRFRPTALETGSRRPSSVCLRLLEDTTQCASRCLSRLLQQFTRDGSEPEELSAKRRRLGARLANRLHRRPSILAQIEEAAARCSAGIFLFTKDDDLADSGQPDRSAPRDNVVFEAGYFIGLKGKRNVLIVLEAGSKMPADLGGDIYAMLQDRSDIGPIERVVSGFMSAL